MALFYKNKLKEIEIDGAENMCNENAIQYLGFDSHDPSWVTHDNKNTILNYSWRSHELKDTQEKPYPDIITGIREITASPTTGSIFVCVMIDYDKTF